MLLDWLPSVTLKELAVSREECGDAREVECAGARRKLLLRNCRNSPPIFERMPSAQATQGVGDDE